MNITEAKALLVLIEAYNQHPFRPEAVDLWFEALRSVQFEDAETAVHTIFRTAGRDAQGAVRKLLPSDVRRPAEAYAESRYRRAAFKALAAARTAGTEPAAPSAAQLAARAAARQAAAYAVARYRERVGAAA